jgi:hypothetical protein
MSSRSRTIKNNLVIEELHVMMKLLGLLCYGISQEKPYILNLRTRYNSVAICSMPEKIPLINSTNP